MVQQWTIFRLEAIPDAFRPFGCILAVYLDAVRRLSSEAAWPQSGSHHSASARIDDAPAATRGK